MESHICLRQGYQCKCPQCQIWISRWDKELEGFAIVDEMMRNRKSLFQIWERLRAEYPDILRFHHASIEQQFLEFKKEGIDNESRKKPRLMKSPSLSLSDSD